MKSILVATDLTDRSGLAVARGAAIARDRNVPLYLLSVVEDDRPADEVLTDEAAAQTRLEAMAVGLRGVDAHALVETGHAAILIPRIVRQIEAGLVVFGPHRNRGVADWVGRPNLVRLLGGLECPALVTVLPADWAYKVLLVGWDFTEASEAAADAAMALFPQMKMTLGHAVVPAQLSGMSPSLAIAELDAVAHSTAVAPLEEAAAVRGAVSQWQTGTPCSVLRKLGEDIGAEVIAVGRHRRGPLERLMLGDTAMALALDAPCDVLITPPPA